MNFLSYGKYIICDIFVNNGNLTTLIYHVRILTVVLSLIHPKPLEDAMPNVAKLHREPKNTDELTINGGILLNQKRREAPLLTYDVLHVNNHHKMVVVYEIREPSQTKRLKTEWVSFLVLTMFGWYQTPCFKMCNNHAPGAPKTFKTISVDNQHQEVTLFLQNEGVALPPTLIKTDCFTKWASANPMNQPRIRHVLRATRA